MRGGQATEPYHRCRECSEIIKSSLTHCPKCGEWRAWPRDYLLPLAVALVALALLSAYVVLR